MEIELKKTLEALVCGYIGRGVLAVRADENGHLIFTMTDGTEVDLGRMSGDKGEDGRGIVSVVAESEPTAQPGATDTYIITYTDGTTSRFSVYNGKDSEGGSGGSLALDTTLTKSGYAADAKATGDAIGVAKQAAAAAQSTADSAATAASNAQTKADLAYTTAGTAQTMASAAKTAASDAQEKAVSAGETAEQAAVVAQEARDTAATAATQASTAQTTAEEAATLAQEAKVAAATASTQAAKANTSIGALDDLTTTAKTNLVMAINEVKSSADTAKTSAEDAVKAAGIAAANADGAQATADDALTKATAAQNSANEAATKATTNAGSIGDMSALDVSGSTTLVEAVNRAWANSGGDASGAMIDDTLTKSGYAADAAVTGEKIALAQTTADSAYSMAESARTTATVAEATATSAKTTADTNAERIGDLNALNTDDKTSLVAAVNEILTGGSGSGTGGGTSGTSWEWVSVGDNTIPGDWYPSTTAGTALKIFLTDGAGTCSVMEIMASGAGAMTEMAGYRFCHNAGETVVYLDISEDGSITIEDGDWLIDGLYYTVEG